MKLAPSPNDFYEFGRTCPPRPQTPYPTASAMIADEEVPDRPSAPPPREQPAIRPEDFGDKPVLIWDTETAGLGNPGICQLSYMLVEDGVVTERDTILKLPPGVRMSPDAVKIHKITVQASAAGADPGPELLAFWNLVNRVQSAGGAVVGHNIGFDCRAFSFSCQKLGLTQEMDPRHMVDTMTLSKPYSHLVNARGMPKQFKLSELYEKLYGYPPSWAQLHNAAADVRVTALCFLAGRQQGWW